jgi:sec-independent protein translocase protein TatC
VDKTESSETSQLNELIDKYSPFLKEIRKRILFTLIFFAAASLVGFIFYENIVKFLIEILSLKGINIVFTSPFQFISLAISCGIAVGLVLVFPLIIYQLLSFLKPALKSHEYKMVVRFLPFCIVLFFIGFSFGVLVMKWQIQLFLTKSVELGIGNVLDISKLIGTVLLVSVLMGIAFQFPIILLVLMKIGLLTHNQLSSQRIWVYLGAFFFTILLPLDSVLVDALLALPLILLFEVTLVLDRLFNRRGG